MIEAKDALLLLSRLVFLQKELLPLAAKGNAEAEVAAVAALKKEQLQVGKKEIEIPVAD